MARRTAEGKTTAEVMRCLKRYVAREIFRLLHPTRHEQAGLTLHPEAA
jgi:transposase